MQDKVLGLRHGPESYFGEGVIRYIQNGKDQMGRIERGEVNARCSRIAGMTESGNLEQPAEKSCLS